MTDRSLDRGQRVMVMATINAPTNHREPTGRWWVQLDGHIGLTAVHQDAMVVPDDEGVNVDD